MTVADLLALPALAPARPEVVTGVDPASRLVRWVHTSEIYDISPLLRGGEVLLTTGLGLVGCTPTAHRAYVRGLVDRDVAALVLELGRTFTTAPAALLDAAREAGLLVVVLHGVVPFIDITEVVHAQLVAHELRVAREQAQIVDRLHASALEGGLRGVLELLADSTGAPVTLVANDTDSDQEVVPVPGHPWSLCSGQGRAVLELGAPVVALVLHQGTRSFPVTPPSLLGELAAGVPVTAAEAEQRSATGGFVPGPGQRVVSLVVTHQTPGQRMAAEARIVATVRRVFGPTLSHAGDQRLLLAVAATPQALRTSLARLEGEVDAELRATVGGRLRRLVVGPPVSEVAALARSIPAAEEALVLAEALGLASRTVMSGDLGVYRLLATMVSDEDLEEFVESQLGPLLEADARLGTDLVETLDAYLESGLSKTRAAAALGIRRQSMYGRLHRISHALGDLELDDRQRRTALDLALVSWRLRTSAAARSTLPAGRKHSGVWRGADGG